eukprot:scaffold13653_cov109-Isochrysis_galbana.AAC.1
MTSPSPMCRPVCSKHADSLRIPPSLARARPSPSRETPSNARVHSRSSQQPAWRASGRRQTEFTRSPSFSGLDVIAWCGAGLRGC